MSNDTPDPTSSAFSPDSLPPELTEPEAAGLNRRYSPAVLTLGWGLFWRYVCAHAGLLFLLAGVICFFACNWDQMFAFVKFASIGGLMAGRRCCP